MATRAGNIGVQSGTFGIWGVQLEIGSVATPLEKPGPRYDLSNCQRFFVNAQVLMSAYQQGGTTGQATYTLPVAMRANPILTQISNSSGNFGAVTYIALNPMAVVISANATATGPAAFNVTFSASADL